MAANTGVFKENNYLCSVMTQEQKQSIAQTYGKRRGYDILTPAGIRDGYSYFHITNKSLVGRKTGLPHILKINDNGRVISTRSIPEVMWAIQQIKEAAE